MKKTILLASLATLLFCKVNAQKVKANTGVTGNPNKTVSKKLADLTFGFIPTLGGGYGFEKVKGFPNKIKVSANFMVKNIGFASSKACKVNAIINYQRPRTRLEIEQGVSADEWLGYTQADLVELSPIEKGKETTEKKIFIFPDIPADAWGKRVKLYLKIEFDNPDDELTFSNNLSAPTEFDLINY